MLTAFPLLPGFHIKQLIILTIKTASLLLGLFPFMAPQTLSHWILLLVIIFNYLF